MPLAQRPLGRLPGGREDLGQKLFKPDLEPRPVVLGELLPPLAGLVPIHSEDELGHSNKWLQAHLVHDLFTKAVLRVLLANSKRDSGVHS